MRFLPTRWILPTGILLSTLACTAMPACGETQPAPSFDSNRAWAHLEKQVALGPRSAGTPALEECRKFLESELKSYGLAPVRETFKATTPLGEYEFGNVYADLMAPAPNAPWLLVCSHFDTKQIKGFVGANDGGSSTAVLLEIARNTAARKPRPVHYRFLFLDGEESMRPEWISPDHTYGSRHHAAEIKKSGLASRIRACVLLDMVGEKDVQLNQDAYSSSRLFATFRRAAEQLKLGRVMSGRRLEVRDDHLEFMKVGIDAIDLIDLDYPEWHTLGDTLDKCSQESLDAVGRITLLGLSMLEEEIRPR